MTPEEIDAFVASGQSGMTLWIQGSEMMEKFAASFEARGGAPVFGDDALSIVYLYNDFKVFLTPERMETISRLRNDI